MKVNYLSAIVSCLSLLGLTACYNPTIDALHSGSKDSMTDKTYEDVAFLSDDAVEGRAVGTKGERVSAAYIANRMQEIGLRPAGVNGTFLHAFHYGSNPHVPQSDSSTGIGYNVVGHLDNGAQRTIVVGAHYDHLGHGGFGSLYTGHAIHNGADDNASGVAMMLELARRLSDLTINSNVLFIAFSGEEYGLLGSNALSKSIVVENLNIAFMINMDMVGRYDEDKGLAINGVGTSPIWPIVIDEVKRDQLSWVTSESGSGPSDHSVFYYLDRPVLHFFTGQHEDYHKPSDDLHKINFDGMSKLSQLVYDVILKADEFADIPFSKTVDRQQENMSFKVSLGVMPDYLYDGKGLRIDGILPGRPAEAAGLMKGDIITKLGDTEVTDIYKYMEGLNQHNKGDQADIVIRRDGTEMVKSVTF